jgi:hypothetical protein
MQHSRQTLREACDSKELLERLDELDRVLARLEALLASSPTLPSV